jgi:hypothetical protein
MRPVNVWLPMLLLPVIATAATFRDLPAEVKAQINVRLTRPSNEIAASPFATLTSFEVHGESEDAGVIETMRRLGVKTVVMHNIHMCLPDPQDRRLNAWLDGCEKAGIEVRCILATTDLDLWRQGLANYGKRIRHWSFLNEPNAPTNNDHTKPAVMPEKYVELLAQVRKIRDEVAPGVKLYGPEAAMLQVMEDWPFPWLDRCLQAGLLDQVDGISIHPYRQGYSPRNIPENPSTFEGRPGKGYATYEEQIARLRERTGGKPVAVLEVGWSTTPAGSICEHTQAKFALRQQIQDFALGLDCAVYFLLRERHVDRPCPLWHIENHFGIVHTDNSPKPAYIALQTLYSQLDSGCTKSDLPVEFSDPQVKWFLYQDTRGAVPVLKLVYWLPVPAQDDLRPVDVAVKVGEVKMPAVPVDDTPRVLRLHQVDGKWGYPVLIDLILQRLRDDVACEG